MNLDILENTDDTKAVIYGKTVKVKGDLVAYNQIQEMITPNSFKTQVTNLINKDEMILVVSLRPITTEFEGIESINAYSMEIIWRARLVFVTIKRSNLKQYFFDEDISKFKMAVTLS